MDVVEKRQCRTDHTNVWTGLLCLAGRHTGDQGQLFYKFGILFAPLVRTRNQASAIL
jgi:hypothetical protein